MTGIQAVVKLKQWGYQITLKKDGRISAVLPGGLNAPEEASGLLEDIRRDRVSVVAFLNELETGSQVVQSEVQFFRSGDLCASWPIFGTHKAGISSSLGILFTIRTQIL